MNKVRLRKLIDRALESCRRDGRINDGRRIGPGLIVAGYADGYAAALRDVILALDGIDPSNNSRYWPSPASHNMRWAQQQRMAAITRALRVVGFVRRRVLIEEFGISEAQAAADFAVYKQLFPGVMTYNRSSKRYEACGVGVER